MHICISKLTTIGPDKCLSPGRRQAIIWTNADIFSIGPLGTNFSEILIPIHTFSFKKMHLEMSSGKCRPFCLRLNVLSNHEHNKKVIITPKRCLRVVWGLLLRYDISKGLLYANISCYKCHAYLHTTAIHGFKEWRKLGVIFGVDVSTTLYEQRSQRDVTTLCGDVKRCGPGIAPLLNVGAVFQ